MARLPRMCMRVKFENEKILINVVDAQRFGVLRLRSLIDFDTKKNPVITGFFCT